MNTGEYFRTTDSVKIEKLDRKTADDASHLTRSRAIRLYTTLAGSRGADKQWSFTLQLRGPLMLGFSGSREGKDFIIANAHLDTCELRDLRDAINLKLAEAEPILGGER